MCCDEGKCCGCMPVEKGCLVLAIIIAIANGLILLASITLGALLAARSDAQQNIYFPDYIMIPGIVIAGSSSLLGFIFSVILCHGVCKRRPELVKGYFIFGMVFTGLTVKLATFIVILLDPGLVRDLAKLGLIGAAIYSLFLVLVHKTYTKMYADRNLSDNARLVEENSLPEEIGPNNEM